MTTIISASNNRNAKEVIVTKQLNRCRALELKRTLGIRVAAGYLRNQGWAVEAAALFLARKG